MTMMPHFEFDNPGAFHQHRFQQIRASTTTTTTTTCQQYNTSTIIKVQTNKLIKTHPLFLFE
jgi:hypothetical protein